MAKAAKKAKRKKPILTWMVEETFDNGRDVYRYLYRTRALAREVVETLPVDGATSRVARVRITEL